MQKPTNYDTTQAAGEFEPIKLGGHKMVIKQGSERQSQGGMNMIVIMFDFAEGDEQAGYFMKQFENDTEFVTLKHSSHVSRSLIRVLLLDGEITLDSSSGVS